MSSVRLPLIEAFGSVLRKLARIRVAHLFPDLFLIAGCLFSSVYIRTEGATPVWFHAVVAAVPFIVLIRVATFVAMGVYDILWRYISLRDVACIARANIVSSALIIALTYAMGVSPIPRSVFFLSTILLFCSMVGVRVLRRYLHEYPSNRRVQREGRRTIIYGAGTNGRTVLHRLQTDPELGYQVIGFVDDDQIKCGRKVSGVVILGNGSELDAILARTDARELIVAIAKPTGETLMRLLQTCARYNIKPRLIKSSSEKYQDGSKLELVREIDLGDLLKRGKRSIDLSSLAELIPGRRVLVTGAGGSIGSELAKQIHSLGAAKLLILDHSEYALYEIDRTLRESNNTSLVVPLLTDIKDRGALARIFLDHRPEIIFHAAAYKHVHLVEANPVPAILNNVMGTKNLLDLSEEFQSESFILISTDKAVNPGGVMGMTKRLCELMVTDFGRRTNKRYASVRFGNVLGSSGSLVPLLKEQISQGKAITITHRDMRRYFMLIPEAVSLVLKAASIARPGDIMVLSMGESIRIVDLAKSLISLMGRTEEEVPIIYTGIRPGEKMAEELYLTGAEIGTEHPEILVIPRGDFQMGQVWNPMEFSAGVDEFINSVRTYRIDAKELLTGLIRGESSFDAPANLLLKTKTVAAESATTH